ncbi:energy transducer TonB [Colwelliaceae bacterium 6441]
MQYIYRVFVFLVASHSPFLLAEQWQIEKRAEPKYPIKAAKEGIEGCVKMQFFINSDGIPTYIEPIKSSNSRLFDSAAVKALSKWRYKPTDNNYNKTPQRQTVALSFAMSENADIQNQCDTPMTAESNHIDTFRQDRLSMPIEARNFDTWKNSVAKIVAVLSDDELQHFFQSYSSLINNQLGSEKDKLKAFLISINGLDYFQLMELADIKPDHNDIAANKINESSRAQNAHEFPLMTMKQFFKTWEISDLTIGMESSLYDEISYQLLKVELLITDDGTAKLLRTCRKVSDEMQLALEESINDWQIRKKIKSPATVRLIFDVPAPAEDGAYFQCDYNWNA